MGNTVEHAYPIDCFTIDCFTIDRTILGEPKIVVGIAREKITNYGITREAIRINDSPYLIRK